MSIKLTSFVYKAGERDWNTPFAFLPFGCQKKSSDYSLCFTLWKKKKKKKKKEKKKDSVWKKTKLKWKDMHYNGVVPVLMDDGNS